MKVILRKNSTDDEMIDIVTKSGGNGSDILWAVVHQFFIKGESFLMYGLMEIDGEITVKLLVSI